MKIRRRFQPRSIGKPRVPLEKEEQAAGVQLLTAIGSVVFVLGTRRSRGKPCPNCDTFVPEDQGTRQTPGIGDVFAFLPERHGALGPEREALWWEAKRSEGGRMSDDQRKFQGLCGQARQHHVVGDRDDLIGWLILQGYLKSSQVPHYRVASGAKS